MCLENLCVLSFPREDNLLFQVLHPNFHNSACKKTTVQSAEASHTWKDFSLPCCVNKTRFQVGPGLPFQAQLLPELLCKFSVTCPVRICLCEADTRNLTRNTLSHAGRCSPCNFDSHSPFCNYFPLVCFLPWIRWEALEAGATPSDLCSHSSQHNGAQGCRDTAWCHWH